MKTYQQKRKNPKTGFSEAMWSRDKHVSGWKFTGKVYTEWRTEAKTPYERKDATTSPNRGRESGAKLNG